MANVQRIFPYAEAVAEAWPHVEAYVSFCEAGGYAARVSEERLAVTGTVLRFAILDHRGVDYAFPVDVSVTPEERAGLSLPMVVACLQLAAVMGERMTEVSEEEFAAAEAAQGKDPGRGRSLRQVLLDCRKAAMAAFGDDYAEFLSVGAGADLAADLDGTSRAPAP